VEMLGNLPNDTTVSCSQRFNICIARNKQFSAWEGESVYYKSSGCLRENNGDCQIGSQFYSLRIMFSLQAVKLAERGV